MMMIKEQHTGRVSCGNLKKNDRPGAVLSAVEYVISTRVTALYKF